MKKSWRHWFIRKKTVYLKNLQIFRIHFWQSCWNFSKIVRNFAPESYDKMLDFRKRLSNAYNFPSKKYLHEKINLDRENAFWAISGSVVVKVRQNSAQVPRKIRKHLFAQKISSIISSRHRDGLLINMPERDKINKSPSESVEPVLITRLLIFR